MKKKLKVMLFGAAGSLGRLIGLQIIESYGSLYDFSIADYKPERAKTVANSFGAFCESVVVDIRNEASLIRKLSGIDCCIIAFGQEEPYIQRACVKAGVSSVDVNLSYSFLQELKTLNEESTRRGVVQSYMAGYFPGLSGLLVKNMMDNFPQAKEIDVSLLSGTNVHYLPGLSGVIEMMSSLATPVEYVKEGQRSVAKGMSIRCVIPFLQGQKQVLLADYDEKRVMQDLYNDVRFNYWIGADKRSFNRQVSLLNRLGYFKPFVRPIDLHDPLLRRRAKFIQKQIKVNQKRPEITGLTVRASCLESGDFRTVHRSLSVPSDYDITAKIAASLPSLIKSSNSSGVVTLGEFIDLEVLVKQIKNHGIKISDFYYGG